jgi:dTDP-4-amino-4,6-dideoxygalactose transaminase
MALSSSQPYRFVGMVRSAARLAAAAARKGIGIKRPVKPLCVHQLLKLDDAGYPGARELIDHVVSLPLYPSLPLHDLREVVDLLERGA